MESVSKNKVSLHYVPFSKAKVAIISFSLNAKLSSAVLSKLKKEAPCGCTSLADLSSSSAAATSLVCYIKSKMMLRPYDQIKYKLLKIKCGYNDGKFTITAICDKSFGTIVSVSKALASHLNPAKGAKFYKNFIYNLTASIDKKSDELDKVLKFSEACGTLNKGLSENICVSIISLPISKDSDKKLKKLVEDIEKKIPSIDKDAAKKDEAGSEKKSENPSMKCSDQFVCHLLCNFLKVKYGLHAKCHNGSCVLQDPNKKNLNADGLEKFLKNLEKLPNVPVAIAYETMLWCCASSVDVEKFVSSNEKKSSDKFVEELEKNIKACFK